MIMFAFVLGAAAGGAAVWFGKDTMLAVWAKVVALKAKL